MRTIRKLVVCLLVIIGCGLVYLIYAFRFAPELMKVFGEDGRVKFGYDRIQSKWLFNEYQQHELGMDGPHIFRDAHEIVYVKGRGKRFELERQKFTTLPDSLTCYVNEQDTFRFKLQNNYKTDTSIYPMPAKLFAVSDIEGNFKAFKDLLKGNGVVNENLEWTYGNGHLVLVGDFVDRGKEVTQCLWLIYKLEQEAVLHGGMVHYILGNHEMLNFHGDARYVTGKYLELIRRRKMLYRELFAANTELGKWMRTKNVIEKIGDIIFVHGGISQHVSRAGISIPEMNDICRKNMDLHRDEMTDERAKMLLGKGGILWYRGLVTVYGVQKLNSKAISIITGNMHCKYIAVGHTVVPDVSFDFDDRIIRLNVRHAKREPGAMIIENGKFYRTNTKGNREEM